MADRGGRGIHNKPEETDGGKMDLRQAHEVSDHNTAFFRYLGRS
jgi:hypothetical protein